MILTLAMVVSFTVMTFPSGLRPMARQMGMFSPRFQDSKGSFREKMSGRKSGGG
jgi:hypothetical protein